MSHEQPTDDQRLRAVAAAHEHGRPGYPVEAVRWMVPGRQRHVLEVGAGIGKLTEQLLAAGHTVHAVDHEPVMLDVLSGRLDGARTTVGNVEELELPHRSVDEVLCTTAFTSFDLSRALPVLAKALRPGGHLSVVWHERDTRVPWVRRLGAFLEGPAGSRDNEPKIREVMEGLLGSPLFSFVEEEKFTLWQQVNRETVQDLVLSRSWLSRLPAAERDRAVEEVEAFYADYGRGMDGMQLPYTVHCVRTQVVHTPGLFDDGTDLFAPGGPRRTSTEQEDAAESGDKADDGEAEDRGAAASRTPADGATGEAAPKARYDEDLFRSDGTDTDMLLIDFR